MMGITELLANIGDENIEFQPLGRCVTGAKEKKRDKCTEISFVTEAITTNDIMRGSGKVGVILWIDRDEYSKAYEMVKK